jgi:signal transduction histidine kinase
MRSNRWRVLWSVATKAPDTVVAVALAAGVLVYQLVAGTIDRAGWTATVVVVVSAAAVAARRRWPIPAVGAFCAALVLANLSGQSHTLNGPPVLLAWLPLDLAYGLGTDCGWASGLIGAAALAAATQTTSGAFNPLFEMITFGPWLAGRAVLSRRQLAERIAERNEQLDAERTRYAQESVRYERARIARDLHDIVAHCVSVMVVQASAGQRMSLVDDRAAAEAFDSITESAEVARAEIGRLVDMLGGTRSSAPALELHMIDELVQRASATGLTVSYQPWPTGTRVPQPSSEAAYRVVQESLTNAIKHSPGAPVDIVVRESGDQIEVEVVTAAAVDQASGLEQAGGGRGLAGLRERVTACGGTFSAGPTASGGWRAVALLPGPAQSARLTPDRR